MDHQSLFALSWKAGLACLCWSCGSSNSDDGLFGRVNGSTGGQTSGIDAGRGADDASTKGATPGAGGERTEHGSGGDAGSANNGGRADHEGGLPAGGSGTANGGTAGASNGKGGATHVGGAGGVTTTGGVTAAGGATATGGAAGCANPTTFFRDDDHDSFGRASDAVVACKAPSQGEWATVGGDCNDDNAAVHPGQTGYFDAAFATAGAPDSFDYDCSNHEDGEPGQDGAAPASCASLLGLGCTGTGFAATTRTGAGTNPLCGSKTRVTCVSSTLSCTAATSTVTDGYRCR